MVKFVMKELPHGIIWDGRAPAESLQSGVKWAILLPMRFIGSKGEMLHVSDKPGKRSWGHGGYVNKSISSVWINSEKGEFKAKLLRLKFLYTNLW